MNISLNNKWITINQSKKIKKTSNNFWMFEVLINFVNQKVVNLIRTSQVELQSFYSGSIFLPFSFAGKKISIAPFIPTLITMLKKNARNPISSNVPDNAAKTM